MKPTKAQLELLRWMVAQEAKRDALPGRRHDSWRGGDLLGYYGERYVQRSLAEAKAKGREPHDWEYNSYRGGGYANHGWRRAGGTALKNLAERGFAQMVGISIGVPLYVLTDEGRAALAQYTIEPGQLRRTGLGWWLVIAPCVKPKGWWWVATSDHIDSLYAEKTPGSDITDVPIELRPFDEIFRRRDPWALSRGKVGWDPL